ncbi:MAG: MFS transporter [Pseudomonadota bacterium]
MSRFEALQFLNVAHFFTHFFLLIFPTAALAIGPAWEMSYPSVLALGTPLYVAFALGTPVAGWLGDKLDRMGLILAFFLGSGIAGIGTAFATGPVGLMLGLSGLGLSAAIFHPVANAMIPDLAERTGRALAVNGVFGNLGLAAAALGTGILAKVFGWQAAFFVPGLVSTLIGCVLWARRRNGVPPVSAGVATNRPVVDAGPRGQRAVFALVCVAALFGGLVFNVITVSLPKLFDERLGALAGDLALIGASAGLIFFLAAFAQLPVGELLDRFGARRILLGLLSAQIIMLAALSQASGWIVLPLALLLVTVMFAELPITGWLLGRYLQSSLRARAVSVEYLLSLGMGSAALPAIAVLHANGLGFDVQLGLLAASTSVVALTALFLLPADGAAPETHAAATERV